MADRGAVSRSSGDIVAVMPISVPGLWEKIPAYLFDAHGPFVIRWRHLPGLLPWLIRFVRAGSNWDKIERCAVERYRLCTDNVVIGRASECADVIYAFGHGHSGLCQAPATAEAVAALATGTEAPFPTRAFSPQRFHT